MPRRVAWAAAVAAVCGLLVAGCGPAGSKTVVSGQITRAGKPLTLPGRAEATPKQAASDAFVPDPPQLMVTLLAMRADGKAGAGYSSAMDASTGQFRIQGHPSKPIRPGRYRLGLGLSEGGPEWAWLDEFDPVASPLVVEIPARDVELAVDLDAKTVTVR
jgi:hypothetical protein